jgi:HSP20 family molecular chaperone IbpA
MLNSIFNMPQEDREKMLKALEMAQKSIDKLKATDAYKGGKVSFDTIMTEADRIFEDVFGSKPEKEKPTSGTSTTDKPYGFSPKTGTVEVPLAGYAKEDIKVTIEDNILVIENINKSKADKIVKYRIPGEIENLKCSMEHGLLTVEVIRPTKKPDTLVQWN